MLSEQAFEDAALAEACFRNAQNAAERWDRVRRTTVREGVVLTVVWPPSKLAAQMQARAEACEAAMRQLADRPARGVISGPDLAAQAVLVDMLGATP